MSEPIHTRFEDEEDEEDEEYDEEYDDEDQNEGEEEELGQTPWLPPGADRAAMHKKVALFSSEFDDHFKIAERLAGKSADLIQAVCSRSLA